MTTVTHFVFTVGGGATSKRSRPLLHCRLKRDRGKIHSFERHGHFVDGYLGVPGCERRMLLDYDVEKNDDKNDLSRKERGQRSVCIDGIVSGFSLHDPNGRNISPDQELPDIGSFQGDQRKAGVPTVRESAIFCGSRWGQDLSKGKVGSVDVKINCEEAKNSAHRDFGRNGGLEDSTLGRATKIIMSKPQNSWFYYGGWTPWAAPQEQQPAASDLAPAYQPAPDPPAPMPKTEPQEKWESWDET